MSRCSQRVIVPLYFAEAMLDNEMPYATDSLQPYESATAQH